MTARSPSTSTCSTTNWMVGSEANPCQPARHSSYPVHRLPSGAGPVPSITQSSAMSSTSLSGARSRKAALYWSMTAVVSVMAASSAALGFASTPWREWHQGGVWATIIGDVSIPDRAAALAHGAPVEPAGAGDTGGHHPAARELHRTGPLPTGAQRGHAAGGGDGPHAARAQRAAPRRWLRPGVPGVTARRRGTPADPRGAGHDARRPPSVPGDGRTTTRHPRHRQPGVRAVPRGRRPRVAGAAGQRVPPRPPPRRHGAPGSQPAGVGPAHHRESASPARAEPGPVVGGVARRARGLPAAAAGGGRRARLRRAAGAGLGRRRPPAHHHAHVVRHRRRRDARRAAPGGVSTRRRVHRRGAAPPMGVTIDDARAIAATLPRSYEALVRDRVKFRVGRIVYAAFSRGETIMGFGFPGDEREALVASEPDKFLMPRPSDMRYQWVCVRLDAIDVDELQELLVDAWRMCVPKKVAAAYEG